MLRARLTFGLLPLLLLFLLVCAYAFRTSQELGATVEDVLGRNFRSIQVVESLRSSLNRMDAVLNAGRAGTNADSRRLFDEERARFSSRLSEELLALPQPGRAELLMRLDSAFAAFAAAANEQLRFPSLAALTAENGAFLGVNAALDALRAREQEEVAAAGRQARARTDEALGLLLGAMGAAVVLFFVLAWRLARVLLGPIQVLTTSAVALGEGNLEIEVPVTSRDELGRLAKAFNTMAVHLRAYREATLAKVLRTQRTMEATLTSTPDPVFVLSRDASHNVRNPAAEQLAQTPAFAEGFPAGLAEPLARVMATGEHYLPTDYGRVVTLRVAREERHYLPRILAIGDKLTEFSGAAMILQDVTKFRLLDDVKTNLVGTVSHELKTPLTSLRMAVYLLLEPNLGPLEPRQRELLEGVRDDVDRLLRMLDSLLDLARLEGGVSALQRTDEMVEVLLLSIADEARPLIEASGQRLLLRIEPGTGGRTVAVDVARIRHVFMNLLTNAAKYSPPGGTVTLAAGEAPLGFVRFTVLDEGPGVPEESIPHVFDRFYRVPGQTKPGTGLGLAIARDIVVAHGGSITCRRSEGAGAEFQFLLPSAGLETGAAG
jgi:NtrC-family two-component system sensor histidine kinase KinB